MGPEISVSVGTPTSSVGSVATKYPPASTSGVLPDGISHMSPDGRPFDAATKTTSRQQRDQEPAAKKKLPKWAFVFIAFVGVAGVVLFVASAVFLRRQVNYRKANDAEAGPQSSRFFVRVG